jgi:hypothetical protein
MHLGSDLQRACCKPRFAPMVWSLGHRFLAGITEFRAQVADKANVIFREEVVPTVSRTATSAFRRKTTDNRFRGLTSLSIGPLARWLRSRQSRRTLGADVDGEYGFSISSWGSRDRAWSIFHVPGNLLKNICCESHPR